MGGGYSRQEVEIIRLQEALKRAQDRENYANMNATITREYERQANQNQNHYTDQINLLMQQLSEASRRQEEMNQKFKLFQENFEHPPKRDISGPEELRAVQEKARRDLRLDTVNYYNFAFVGHSKTGKSSLVNAIRGLDDEEEGAAKVNFLEQTHFVDPYQFTDPRLKHVRVYDVPGAGTLRHDSKSYYDDKKLCAFDCVIIVTKEVLGAEEIGFALQALEYSQPIAFVRSRCDLILDTAAKKKEIRVINQEAVDTYIARLFEGFRKEIERTGKQDLFRVPCFFLNCFNLRDFVNGEETQVYYQEKEFLEYIISQSKYARNMHNM